MTTEAEDQTTAVSRIYFWASTHVGHVRSQNEDAFAVSGFEAPPDTSSCEGELDLETPWALVADGIGGHPGGDVASKLAVACLAELFSPVWQPKSVSASLTATDQAIRHAMQLEPSLSGMGTTIAGAVVRADQVFTFSIGDSRIYLLRESQLFCISKDHVVEKHILSECLGGSSPAHEREPDTFSHRAIPGSRILLCTDGLTDLVRETEIRHLMENEQSPANALVSAALQNGGHDNVTAVVLAFS